MEWSPVGSRIIIAWFHSKYKKISIIYVYAPTSEACDEDKDQFYEELQTVVDRCNRHDMVIITGYMNAKVGSDNEDMEQVIGKQGMGVRNGNGERLCEFCQMNGYVITGTLFSHKDIHKATWVSPDGRTKNQIDHVLIKKEFRTSVADTRACRGADVSSNYYLVRTKMRMKLSKNENGNKIRPKVDLQRLEREDIQRRYNVEVKNRLEVLQDKEDLDDYAEEMEKAYVQTAETILGFANRKSKPWLGDNTWQKVPARKAVKQRIESAKSARVKGRLRKEYRTKDSEVKYSTHEDRKKRMGDLAEEAEIAEE